MRLHTLRPAPGSLTKTKRVGRGQGSGKGGTAARGTKGHKSRSGYKVKRGFEGGQMPLQRRLPKFGFHNPFRVEYNIFNLDTLQAISEKYNVAEITPEFLILHRFISKNSALVKILGDGEMNAKLTIKAHKFSESAKQKIEQLGGQVITLEK